MQCSVNGKEYEPYNPREGVLQCPYCSEELDEETLEPIEPDGAGYEDPFRGVGIITPPDTYISMVGR